MTESFVDLFEESILNTKFESGSIVKGTVVRIDNDFVILDAGLKSEGVVPKEQFLNAEGELEVVLGDEVDLALDTIEDGFGETILSREKAKRYESWCEIEKSFQDGQTVMGRICDKVKGGFTVDINKVKAFLPGSLVDLRPVRDSNLAEGQEIELKVIKMDQKRNNVVVSRKAVVEEESSAEREALLEEMHEGQALKGIVKNLTDYGAFVDLGGIDGLLHITDISWKRVKHPSEALTVGQEIDVKVLRFDRERNRVSLGMKQLGEDPWKSLTERFPVGETLSGKVTNITDYGCFVEIEDGVEGLVHMSEMDWTNKNIHPNKVVSLGQEVNVKVLEIDESRRRISLGMKQCAENPWEVFCRSHEKGEKISGAIRSITDFGIFIGLDGAIDGLVHLTDISWNMPGEEAIREYRKGQEVEAVILGIDPERERISLGIKQLESDPIGMYIDTHPRGSIVTGTVTEVEEKQAVVQLADDVFGGLHASEISEDKVDDVRNVIKVGDPVEVRLMGVDKKTRVLELSIKAKNAHEEAEALKEYASKSEETAKVSLGDILKEKIDTQSDSEE